MAKAPADRPESAVELGRLLQDAQRQTGQAVTSMALAAVQDATPGFVSVELATSDETTPGPTRRAELPTAGPVPPSTRVLPSRRRGALPLAAIAIVVLIAGVLGNLLWPGGNDGPGTKQAKDEVTYPSGLAVAPDGSVYVCDQDRHRVIRIDQDGDVEVVAGTGTAANSGDGGLATDAGLEYPSAVALTPDGELYVASGAAVRRIDADGMIGPVPGFPDDFRPVALAARRDGTLFAADKERVVVRDRSGLVTKLAREGSVGSIEDIALHPDGWLAVSDPTRDLILRITSDGEVSRVAGLGTASGGPEGDGLPARDSAVSDPTGLAFDEDGRLFFSEAGTNRVRVVEPDGTLRTVAGSPEGYSEGDSGDGGAGRSATFRLLGGPLALDRDANLYVGDVSNQRVRRVDPEGLVHPFA